MKLANAVRQIAKTWLTAQKYEIFHGARDQGSVTSRISDKPLTNAYEGYPCFRVDVDVKLPTDEFAVLDAFIERFRIALEYDTEFAEFFMQQPIYVVNLVCAYNITLPSATHACLQFEVVFSKREQKKPAIENLIANSTFFCD